MDRFIVYREPYTRGFVIQKKKILYRRYRETPAKLIRTLDLDLVVIASPYICIIKRERIAKLLIFLEYSMGIYARNSWRILGMLKTRGICLLIFPRWISEVVGDT